MTVEDDTYYVTKYKWSGHCFKNKLTKKEVKVKEGEKEERMFKSRHTITVRKK